jgi:GT2 family glycosyltransferase
VPQPASPQLDICIVSWRARDLLRACLHSVVGNPEASDIVVVDNASADGTAEMLHADFPTVRLIANEENRSFAAGNNQAIRATRSPFLLLLNPDTEVQPGALRALLDVFAEEPRAGAAAAQLVLPDDSIQRSCRSFPEPAPILYDAFGFARLFPRSQTFGRYRMTYWGYDTRREVDQPMASALALRRAALDEVGLFDEGFPLYFNDVDLCYRLRQAGWRVIFEPTARVRHHHGQSTRLVRPAALLDSHRGLIRFYRKHYRGRIGWFGYTAVTLGSWLTMYPRAALAWIADRLRGR